MDQVVNLAVIQDHRTVTLGCDPEFFFSSNGKIVGSEKVLVENGLSIRNGTYGKIVIDGVQAELNPTTSACRESLGAIMAVCFRDLYSTMKSKNVNINFSPTVKMDQKELDQLSEKSKTFGCAPSKNLKGESKISVDPATYTYRSAGGHIHLGTNNHPSGVKIDPEKLVNILDVVVGNTCVLVDRDPMNIERRKVYGKAGEFRTPPHGVEYRTLSNFWLRNYTLFSMVFALARQSIDIIAKSTPEHDYYSMVMNSVDKNKIDRAINENKYLLAYKNYKQVLPVMHKIITPLNHNCVAFNPKYEKEFRFFITKKMDYWFPKDPLEHWMKLQIGSSKNRGWESFIAETVPQKMTLMSRAKDLVTGK